MLDKFKEFPGLPRPERKFDTFKVAMDRFNKRPMTGITQGGSSKPNKPARVAAKNGNVQK